MTYIRAYIYAHMKIDVYIHLHMHASICLYTFAARAATPLRGAGSNISMNIDLSSTSRAHVQRCLRGRMIYYVCMRIHADKRKNTHEHKPSPIIHTKHVDHSMQNETHTAHIHAQTQARILPRLHCCGAARAVQCKCMGSTHAICLCNPPVEFHDETATQNTHLKRHTAYEGTVCFEGFHAPMARPMQKLQNRGEFQLRVMATLTVKVIIIRALRL